MIKTPFFKAKPVVSHCLHYRLTTLFQKGGVLYLQHGMFFKEYSSEAFSKTVEKYLSSEFVQLPTGQIENITTAKAEAGQYKRILISQERMQEQLNEFCQFFLTEKKSGK